MAQQNFHIYHVDEMDYGFGQRVRRVEGGEDETDDFSDVIARTGLRIWGSFLTAAILIAVTHKILRETVIHFHLSILSVTLHIYCSQHEYIPILPMASMVLASLLIIGLSIQVYRLGVSAKIESKREERLRRVGCLVSSFILVQLLLHFPLQRFISLAALHFVGNVRINSCVYSVPHYISSGLMIYLITTCMQAYQRI